MTEVTSEITTDSTVGTTITTTTDNTPPESGWLYRRWYTFVGSAVFAGLIGWIIYKLTGQAELKWIGLALIGAAMIKDSLYMAGAYVLDYAKLAAAWKGNKE